MTGDETRSDLKTPDSSPAGKPAESETERLKKWHDSIGEALAANLNKNVRRRTPTP